MLRRKINVRVISLALGLAVASFFGQDFVQTMLDVALMFREAV